MRFLSICVCICVHWGQTVCSSTCYNTADKQGKQPCAVCSPTVVMWSTNNDEILCLSCEHDVHRSVIFPTLSASSSMCGSSTVWAFSFKNENPDIDNLSPAVQFLGQRSWLQCLSWLGRLTVGVVALDGIQYRAVSSHVSITFIPLSAFVNWLVQVVSMCVYRGSVCVVGD